MTDFPSPSDRPKAAKSAVFRLFRPALFSITVIGGTLGAAILMHGRPGPDVATAAPATPDSAIVLPEPEPPPPLADSDFKGFQLKSPDAQTDAEPAVSDRYDLT